MNTIDIQKLQQNVSPALLTTKDHFSQIYYTPTQTNTIFAEFQRSLIMPVFRENF
jgi:hypothetical protein